MIQKGNFAITQQVIDSSYLDAWEDMQILVKCKSPGQLKAIVKEAESVKIRLMKMIQTNAICPIRDVRKMQKFFNNASSPYLSSARCYLRRLERIRQGCFMV